MKKIEITNKILIILSLLVNTVYIILTLIGKFDSNILVCLSYYILVILPIIFRKFKINFSDMLELVYLIFIILACLMGSIMKFYSLIYFYDSLVHYISGILTALLGLVLLIWFNKFKSKEYSFNILYMFFVSLAVAALWEIFEFSADNLLGGDAQKVIETGVTDTMKDIICALLGSLLVSVCYAYEYVNNKKLIITNFIKGLN